MPPGLAAGDAVQPTDQKNGTDLGIVFEATRVSNPPMSLPDYTKALNKIRINNWTEINLLDIVQFQTGPLLACTPITTDLDSGTRPTMSTRPTGPWRPQLLAIGAGNDRGRQLTPGRSGHPSREHERLEHLLLSRHVEHAGRTDDWADRQPGIHEATDVLRRQDAGLTHRRPESSREKGAVARYQPRRGSVVRVPTRGLRGLLAERPGYGRSPEACRGSVKHSSGPS